MDMLSALGSVDAVTVEQSLAALVAAYLMCQAIAAVYAYTYRGLSYSRAFVQALVVGGIVGAMLMLAIGNSLARGIGIMGTLALIRFRTNLRDPLDMVFVFASFGAGIAAGTGNWVTGALGTTLFLAVVSIIRLTGFGAMQEFDGVARVRLPAGESSTKAIEQSMHSLCSRFSLVTLREVAQGTEIELAYQFTLKRGNQQLALSAALSGIPGASDVALSMQEPTVEL